MIFLMVWTKVSAIWRKKNGVNLDYYYKMSESTKRSEEAKQAVVCRQNEMREGAKKGTLYL
jgi:hypothetical protein